jgi:hypothetical protein
MAGAWIRLQFHWALALPNVIIGLVPVIPMV